MIGESDHILSKIAKAQIKVEEEGKDVQDEVSEEQESNDHSTGVSNGLSLRLDRAHFIPLTPLSDNDSYVLCFVSGNVFTFESDKSVNITTRYKIGYDNNDE